MDQCPTVEQLERWLLLPPDNPVFHELEVHVDECPRCQQALERLTASAGQQPHDVSLNPLSRTASTLLARSREKRPIQERLAPERDVSAGQFSPATPGSLPRLEHEIRALLHRRLRVVTVVIAAVFLTFGLLALSGGAAPDYAKYSDWLGRALIGVGFLVAAECAVIVWMRRSLSLASLRLVELLVFGVALAFAAKFRYSALMHGLDGSWEGPSHRDLFVTHIIQINNTFWDFAIICYGVFIPNTWRRCIAVVAVMVLIPVAITMLAGFQHEAVREQLAFLLGFTMLGLLVSASLAVFGTFKISSLQQEAFAARQVGQYQLKERLGAGGMGEVYLAEHRLLKRPCAVKLIRPERASDPHLLRRFEREVQATARLNHFNTIEIYDYGHTEDGTFYYVMEYLPGLSLEQLVAREGPQPPARVVHFLRQLCGALGEAHEAGLVHRDIKPSNIIVCKHGGRYDVVKLLDFGLVRTLHVSDAEATKLTTEGLILGTPEFMSPEQASGSAVLDGRSDLYSLGAVAYFLLTGRSPFAGQTVLHTLVAHLHQPPPPLTSHRLDVPDDVEAIVFRCLAKDPGQRFPDAASLEQALEQCAGAAPWTQAQARQRWQTWEDEGAEDQSSTIPP